MRAPASRRRIIAAMRLLLTEDDPMLGSAVQTALRQDNDAVDWVQDGIAALAALRDNDYALVLLDLGLPRKDGVAVLRELRAAGHDLPVLILTARDAVAARVQALDAGADDYLVKPFDLDELGARIRALLRRRSGSSQPVLRHGALELDPARHSVSLAGQPLKVSAREFALLRTLLEQPGQPLSRAQLEERLYGWQEEVDSNAVEVHIHALRRKLGAAWIANVRGVGYFIPEPPPRGNGG